MIKTKFLLLIILLAGSSVLFGQRQSDDEKSIRSVLIMQQAAWNEGDLNKFMNGYWKSDQLCFVGGNGIIYGWEKVLENYTQSYSSVEEMGKLKFDILNMISLNDNAYMVLGKYTLERNFDMPTGYFTKIWKKIEGNWKIISDHTSSSVKGS